MFRLYRKYRKDLGEGKGSWDWTEQNIDEWLLEFDVKLGDVRSVLGSIPVVDAPSRKSGEPAIKAHQSPLLSWHSLGKPRRFIRLSTLSRRPVASFLESSTPAWTAFHFPYNGRVPWIAVLSSTLIRNHLTWKGFVSPFSWTWVPTRMAPHFSYLNSHLSGFSVAIAWRGLIYCNGICFHDSLEKCL